MKPAYSDIRDKIAEKPLWFDQNGTPRYSEFKPDLAPCIYARQVIFFEIKCQACRKTFHVEMNQTVRTNNTETHYGDPPSHGCVGDTMNCEDLRILEFWTKEDYKWKRNKKLEVLMLDHPDYGRKIS